MSVEQGAYDWVGIVMAKSAEGDSDVVASGREAPSAHRELGEHWVERRCGGAGLWQPVRDPACQHFTVRGAVLGIREHEAHELGGPIVNPRPLELRDVGDRRRERVSSPFRRAHEQLTAEQQPDERLEADVRGHDPLAPIGCRA